jgi:hypothetical protein
MTAAQKQTLTHAAAMVVGAVIAAVSFLVTACAGSTNPKLAAAESDLCKARADWKVIAAVAGGALDPKPGTPRAKLEAAEDALCAARASASPPAGSSPLPSSSAPDAAP